MSFPSYSTLGPNPRTHGRLKAIYMEIINNKISYTPTYTSIK